MSLKRMERLRPWQSEHLCRLTMDGKQAALCLEHLCRLTMDGNQAALCLEHLCRLTMDGKQAALCRAIYDWMAWDG